MSSRLDAHCSCSNFHKLKRLELLRPGHTVKTYSTLSPSKTQSIWLEQRGSAIQAGGRRGHRRGVDQRGAHFERDPIPYALDIDWPVGAGGFEPLHLKIGIAAELHPPAAGF